LQGDGGTFRLRIATQKLELLTGTLIAGINSSYVAVVAGILYCALLRSSCHNSLACAAAQGPTRTWAPSCASQRPLGSASADPALTSTDKTIAETPQILHHLMCYIVPA